MAQQEATETKISRLRRQIEAWRRLRRRGRAMPEHLWVGAVEVAEEVGAYAASQRLGVSYNTLRSRLPGKQRSAGDEPQDALTKVEFVDVGPAMAFGAKKWGTEIEAVSRSGKRIIVRIGTGGEVDPIAVARALWAGS